MEKDEIRAVHYQNHSEGNRDLTGPFGLDTAKQASAFHRSIPGYQPTPLVRLDHLAEKLGVRSLSVKDESRRFSLNAFKVLGSSYAIGNILAERLGIPPSEISFEDLIRPEVKAQLGDITFITATDGNHGRGVAWAANKLHQKSVVYMPKGSKQERLKNIQKLGADASITDWNYDATVRFAKEQAEKNDWVLVQDTAWEGYEKIPLLIMQGYTTMAYEAMEQLNGERPTHIFLQAGVGSMAAAVCSFFMSVYEKEERPIITVVEPCKAECFFRTAEADDGSLHAVTGEMDSIMAGLCCGVPSPIAWDILQKYANHFISIPDYVAEKGMRTLGVPLPGDERIISGESGASSFGLVTELLENPEYSSLKQSLHLDNNSKILCFSTEGDTDRENYQRIVFGK